MAESEVRLAAVDDVGTIAAVLSAAFAPYQPQYTPEAYDVTVLDADRIAARFDEGPTWVALVSGVVVGTIAARPDGDDVYVRSLAVHPSARGHGVGERLVAAVVDWAIAAHATRLTLSTTPFLTASRRLYQRCGFVADPERAGADLHGTPLIALVRRLRREGHP
jgi:GNAT superfamily N-acetyltransferase